MKILQVITSLRMGGAEKLIATMVPRLRQHQFDTDLLLFDGMETSLKKKLRESGIRIFELGVNRPVYNPRLIGKLIPYLKQYDIIHTHNTACQYYTVLAKIISSNKKVKLVTTEHSTNNRRRNYIGFRLIDRFIYSYYDAIIAVSNKTTELLKSHIGDRSPVYTVLNGIDPVVYQEAVPLDKKALIGSSSVLITMVAGFREEKDQDTVIRALALLPSHYSLCLAGDGIRRRVCEELAKSLGVEKRVFFVGVRQDIPQLLKTSDIVIMSSHWEGFGLAAVEGMAAGKPVIASDVDGLAQIITGAGILFPAGDSTSLADRIIRLTTDNALYRRVARQCAERAKEFDIRKTIIGYEKIYQDLFQSCR